MESPLRRNNEREEETEARVVSWMPQLQSNKICQTLTQILQTRPLNYSSSLDRRLRVLSHGLWVS